MGRQKADKQTHDEQQTNTTQNQGHLQGGGLHTRHWTLLCRTKANINARTKACRLSGKQTPLVEAAVGISPLPVTFHLHLYVWRFLPASQEAFGPRVAFLDGKEGR